MYNDFFLILVNKFGITCLKVVSKRKNETVKIVVLI